MRYFLIAILFGFTAQAALIPNHEQQIQLSIQQQLVQLQMMSNAAVSRLMRTVWNDPSVNGCQVMTDLGTNAAPLRNAYSNFKSFINSQGGSITAVEPVGYTLSNNQDGTVNCATPSPSPSPTPGP